MLFTKAQEAALRAAANGKGKGMIVKLFTPWTGATWLISEISEDGTAFGLCDLGHGSPELGYVSLSEIQALRSRTGLRVERDRFFTATKTLEQYADDARAAGRITV